MALSRMGLPFMHKGPANTSTPGTVPSGKDVLHPAISEGSFVTDKIKETANEPWTTTDETSFGSAMTWKMANEGWFVSVTPSTGMHLERRLHSVVQ